MTVVYTDTDNVTIHLTFDQLQTIRSVLDEGVTRLENTAGYSKQAKLSIAAEAGKAAREAKKLRAALEKAVRQWMESVR